MDSAIQSSIGFTLSRELALPFALEKLEIIDRCVESMWAWVRLVESGKLDIDLCDEQGKVCVKICGLSFRRTETESPLSNKIGTLMLKPVWKETSEQPSATEYTEHRVFLCGFREEVRQEIAALRPSLSPISFIDSESLEKSFENSSLELFTSIQKILQTEGRPGKSKVLLQVLVPAQGSKQVFSGLSGLLKTACLESPKILGQVIAVNEAEKNPKELAAELISKLLDNAKFPEEQQIRYEAIGQSEESRLVASFEEITPTEKEQASFPWKENGVYLVTGGVGGLGLIFAKEIIEKTRGSKLILIGRSLLNPKIRAKLEELQALGAKAEYKSVDIADQKAVASLIQKIQKDFGTLNGIIHSAGVIRDNFILKKTREEFKQVLAPKVGGVLNLDQATKNLDLDFFVLFSSIVGAIGNVGQADYSTANSFIDAFSQYRNSLPGSQSRKILSINWPLWREGGMGMDETTEELMKENMGLVAMETSSGIEAFYQGLSSNESQVIVMEGLLKRMKQKLGLRPGRSSKSKHYWPNLRKTKSLFCQFHIPYESLVMKPEVWMRTICDRLGVEFNQNMVNPYQNLESDMVSGLHRDSMMIGDPNFLTHNKIDPQLIYAWEANQDRWSSLQASTLNMAEKLGYSINEKNFAPQVEREESSSLLPAQEGFLQRNGESPRWIIINETRIKTRLQREKLQQNFSSLLQSHPLLRTRFKPHGSSWIQEVESMDRIKEKGKNKIIWLDGRNFSEQNLLEEKKKLLVDLQNKIDIQVGSVIFVALIQDTENTYYCLILLHHLVADGFSLQQIFDTLLHSSEVLPVRIPQKEYQEYIKTYCVPSFLSKLKFDYEQSSNEDITFLPGKKDLISNIYQDEVEYRETLQVEGKLSWESIASPLYLLLAQGSKKEKITLAHRFHRRNFSNSFNHADDIGYYAGDFPIVVDVMTYKDAKSIRQYLLEYHSEIILGGVGYEILANSQQIKPGYELTEVRLNYQPFSRSVNDDSKQIEEVNTFLLEPDHHIRLYDLDCIVRKQGQNQLLFVIRYNKNQYSEKKIQSFVADWTQNIF